MGRRRYDRAEVKRGNEIRCPAIARQASVYAVFTVVKNSCAYLPCSRGP
jgi:hypothetical protein